MRSNLAYRIQVRVFCHCIVGMFLVTVAGCAAYQEVVTLNLRHAVPDELWTSKGQPQAFRVAVAPFQDRRGDPSRLGRYTRFWRKEVPLIVEGANLGEVLALDTIEYLKIRKGWETWIDRPDIVLPAQGVDLTVSGYIVEWMTEVKDRGLWTGIQARVAFSVQVTNVKDRRSYPVHIVKEDSFWIFGFEASALSEWLTSLFHRGLEEMVEQSRGILPNIHAFLPEFRGAGDLMAGAMVEK